MADPIKVGLIGCGVISSVYLRNCQAFAGLEVVSCADLIPQRAASRASEFGLVAMPVEALLVSPDIQIVLNLTVPKAHAEVSLAALQARKHVYSEKPLAITLQDGRRILETAQANGLTMGCAPDTFLGAGLQTCRRLIDSGEIGTPVAATAFMLNHGHESWHPDPDFYYQPGGGPLFDMGPYYLTALVSLLGPIRRVTGSERVSFPERTITSRPRAGQKIQVNVPTHAAALLDFSAGPVVTLVTSFDVWGSRLPAIEIYGETGSLLAPDPNTFGGPVSLYRPERREWSEQALIPGYTHNARGLGLADMARAIQSGSQPRASGELALHVLEVMHAIHSASELSRHIMIESVVQPPPPLDLPADALDH